MTGFYLQVLTREGGSARALPDEGVLVIGRGQAADLRVDDKAISRRHAELVIERRRVRLVDLGSRNGTRVNGKRLRGERALRSGDVVSIGSVTLVLHAEEQEDTRTVEAAQSVEPMRIELGARVVHIASPAMQRVYELLRRLASSEMPVLIRGETGVGKESAAFAVHHWSARREGPYVAVNSAALPESVIESELFGHVRGAFTGAVSARVGLFEQAHGGTLFLDELGELSRGVQAKLLRVLEDGVVTPIGAGQARRVDVRVVAATSCALEDEAVAGRFRRDLYFRLASAAVTVPPLRERVHEVPVLARVFLTQACARLGRAPMRLGAGTERALLGHAWPGNVRELRNLMEYAAAANVHETVDPGDLEARLQEAALLVRGAGAGELARENLSVESVGVAAARPPLAEELRALERRRIVEALAQTGGVQKRAAALIGMPLRTFASKVKHYGLRRDS